jgi:hypothetical protein
MRCRVKQAAYLWHGISGRNVDQLWAVIGGVVTEPLLTAVRDRFLAYVSGDNADPALVLADDVAGQAAELWRVAKAGSSDGAVQFKVVEIIAWLHWSRYQCLPVGEDRNDLQIAAVMFGHLYRVDPNLVPDELHKLLSAEQDFGIQDNIGIPAWASQSSSDMSYPSASDRQTTMGPEWWVRHASAILARAETGEDPAAVDHAVDLLRTAIRHTPADDEAHAERLSSLGNGLLARFNQTGNPADLDEAVEHGVAAVAAIQVNDCRLASILSNLCAALGTRFKETDNLADLEDAIIAGLAAVKVAPADHPDRLTFLSNLERSQSARFAAPSRTAVPSYRAAAEAARADRSHRTRILTELSKRLRLVESTLATVEARALAYFDGDPSQALSDEAESEACGLWYAARNASTDSHVPFDVAYTIAMLHWCRYNAMPAGKDHNDLQVAAVLFAHVLRVEPDLVPGPLRELIDNAGYLNFSDNVGIFPWGPSYSAIQYPSSRDPSFVSQPVRPP